MIDFFFAIVAAGLNSTGSDQSAPPVNAAAAPAAVVAPLVTPQAQALAVPQQTPPASVRIAPGSVVIGQGTLLEGVPATPAPAAIAAVPAQPAVPVTPSTPAVPGLNMAVVPAGLVAEPQTPSGKFTTATEIKPILNATKGNWVAVREYDGQDLLYVTHLWGWRCGLSAMAISLNDEPMQNWPLPACHMKYSTPNAVLEEDGLPYLKLKLGSVRKITIQIVYDDLSMDVATFERGNVLIP